MSRATADVDAVGEFIHRGLIQTTRTALWFGVVAVIKLVTNWQLALIAMAFLPLSTWVLGSLSIKAGDAFTRAQVETGKMTAVLQESIVGMRLAKAFGAASHERRGFRLASAEVTRANYSAYKIQLSRVTLSTHLFIAAVGALLWFGAREVVFGRLTEGELAMFLLYMALLRQPVQTTGSSRRPGPPGGGSSKYWMPSRPCRSARMRVESPEPRAGSRSRGSLSATTPTRKRSTTSTSKSRQARLSP